MKEVAFFGPLLSNQMLTPIENCDAITRSVIVRRKDLLDYTDKITFVESKSSC